jgi:crotonobetainyl-CoA:carnitine CoA-transferase CaiB-like acyl-CoA transferase
MANDRDSAAWALDELLALAGLPSSMADLVTITGADPVLPTRYRIGTAAAGILAATGVAASELWRLRTGRTQTVSVDVPAAAISLRSSRYMQIAGREANREFAPLMRFYPARDGRWVFLHANFPNLRDAALRVLGLPPDSTEDPKAVAAAVAQWDGEALETALHEGGACGAFVRTHAEWDSLPHAAAIADLPAVEITRIGDAPPQPLGSGDRPLAGLRVLVQLARSADVFSQSYRPGTLAARGFGPEALAELRPGIVCVTLSAWGHAGPWRHRRGYDTVVQAATGMAEASGDASGPKHLPVSALDYVGGNLMAFGAMVALARRATEGGSWLVRVSLATTARWILQRGVLAREAYQGAPADLPESAIQRLCSEMETPLGRMRFLSPVVGMSETPAHWSRPAVPLGYHSAAWPA